MGQEGRDGQVGWAGSSGELSWEGGLQPCRLGAVALSVPTDARTQECAGLESSCFLKGGSLIIHMMEVGERGNPASSQWMFIGKQGLDSRGGGLS